MIDAIDNNATKIAHNHDGTPGNGSKIAAANITVADTGNNYTATDVEGALTELFTNVSNGKTAVASAITGKGVAASGSDTFSQLGTKIGQISTGTGNAVAADVLTGKTFTNGISAGITGTMPNNGAATITPSGTGPVMIPAGYHNGSGTVAQVTVPAANVKSGTTIAGVVGTMADRGAVTIAPSASSQVIAAGFHNGSGTVAAVIVPAANVLVGTTIAGTSGTMPNNGAPVITAGTTDQVLSSGYYTNITVKGDADQIPSNIRKNVTINGVTGDNLEYGTGSVINALRLTSSNTMAWYATVAGMGQPAYKVFKGGANALYFEAVTPTRTLYKVNSDGSAGWNYAPAAALQGLAVNADGSTIYFAYGSTLVKMRTSDKFIHWSVPTSYPVANTITYGNNVLLDSSENVYVLCGTSGYVQKFNSSGTLIWTSAAVGNISTFCIAPDSSAVYTFSDDNYNVGFRKINTTTGALILFPGSAQDMYIFSGGGGGVHTYSAAATNSGTIVVSHTYTGGSESSLRCFNLSSNTVTKTTSLGSSSAYAHSNMEFVPSVNRIVATQGSGVGVGIIDAQGSIIQNQLPLVGTTQFNAYNLTVDKTTMDIYSFYVDQYNNWGRGKVAVGQTIA